MVAATTGSRPEGVSNGRSTVRARLHPPPDSTEEQVAELHTQIEGIVTRLHGQIEKTENWGRRKLAYEIGPHKEGFYVLDVINASGELVKELDRRLRCSTR
jgi:small subunit ribosomal protein S6